MMDGCCPTITVTPRRSAPCGPESDVERAVRLHAQGPPDDADRARPIWRSSCATDRHASRPARFRTPTRSRGASSAATSAGWSAGVERFRDELVLEVSEIARVQDADERRSGALPAVGLPGPRRARRLSRAPRRRGLRPRLPGAAERLLADASCGRPGAGRRARRAGHHAYLGGLLEHTVAVATLAHETCQLHPRLNSDLLLTAALTHDLGRTREFTYGAEIGLTEEGRLLGHLVIGERLISERGRRPRRAAAAGAAALRALPPRTVVGPRAAGSPRPRRWRCTGSTPSTPGSRARSSTASGTATWMLALCAAGPGVPLGCRPRVGSPSARQGPGGPSGLQNRQGGAAPRLEGSIPSPRRGWKSGVLRTRWRQGDVRHALLCERRASEMAGIGLGRCRTGHVSGLHG